MEPVIWHYVRTIADGTGTPPEGSMPVQVVNQQMTDLYNQGWRLFSSAPVSMVPGGFVVFHILIKPQFAVGYLPPVPVYEAPAESEKAKK